MSSQSEEDIEEAREQGKAEGAIAERERVREALRTLRSRSVIGNIPGEYMNGWIAAVGAALDKIS